MSDLTRRTFLKGLAALGATSALGPSGPLLAGSARPHVAVVGAGAFGGWTALELQRRGARVTLLDAWGAGNSRASSGGETRMIRRIYGDDRLYTEMASRSLELWKAHQARWNRRLFHPTGVLWLGVDAENQELAALDILDDMGLPYEKFSMDEVAQRYPQIRFDGVQWVVLEPDCGYLLARRGCQAVLEAFRAEGGEYRRAYVEAGPVEAGRMKHVVASGERLDADCYVFACGPWLGRMFAGLRQDLIVPTRQEVFYFGTPPGDSRFDERHMPTWINHERDGIYYGIPGDRSRGFKVANDKRGPRFDPTNGDRMPSREGVEAARHFLARRFPALQDAPMLEARVCQYENSPDSDFIIDRHPEAANAFLVGGGSGHGYKMGPAVGEIAADLVLEDKAPNSLFRLKRFRGIS